MEDSFTGLGKVKKIHKNSNYKAIFKIKFPKKKQTKTDSDFRRKKGNFLKEFLLFYKNMFLLDFLYSKRKYFALASVLLIITSIVTVQFYSNLDRYNVSASTDNAYDSDITTYNDISSEPIFASGQVLSESTDVRVYVLDEYFRQNGSPLYGQSKYFVAACETFNAPKDCISVVAIARHETDLCKYYNSAEMKNCLGWGGGGEYRVSFDTFQDMIYQATDVLVNQYGVEYMDDPRKMENVFCGPQAECDGWGLRVLSIMKDIDNFSAGLGVGRLTDLRDDGLRY